MSAHSRGSRTFVPGAARERDGADCEGAAGRLSGDATDARAGLDLHGSGSATRTRWFGRVELAGAHAVADDTEKRPAVECSSSPACSGSPGRRFTWNPLHRTIAGPMKRSRHPRCSRARLARKPRFWLGSRAQQAVGWIAANGRGAGSGRIRPACGRGAAEAERGRRRSTAPSGWQRRPVDREVPCDRSERNLGAPGTTSGRYVVVRQGAGDPGCM